MNYLTHDEYVKQGKSAYWIKCREGRWEYMSSAIELMEKISPSTILEAGTAGIPLCAESDTIDLRAKYNPTFVHDLGVTPWPIADKAYDLFVALQVWEHLNGKQEEAFREVSRIAKRAILSFPYMWNCPQDTVHHEISFEKIKQWTLTKEPESIIIFGEQNKRIMWTFDFSRNKKWENWE